MNQHSNLRLNHPIFSAGDDKNMETLVETEAAKSRNEAIQLYKAGKSSEALLKFAEGLSKAESNKDFALAYGNQSRVYFKCNLYSLCLDSIYKARGYIDYPKRKMKNLSTNLNKLEFKCIEKRLVILGNELQKSTRKVEEPQPDPRPVPGFGELNLKPEILRAIDGESSFKMPSFVQQKCIPPAILGRDLLCEAKSGTGKTAVFVLSTLQQLKPINNQVSVLVICHTRELALQISKEYERFSKYLPEVTISTYLGGNLPSHLQSHLQSRPQHSQIGTPHIVVGTLGRILQIYRSKELNLDHLKHFIVDECDTMLTTKSLAEIFYGTPVGKQVMMFSATISESLRERCDLFMRNPVKVFVSDETKLEFGNLQHYYAWLKENEKSKKLIKLLKVVQFNQAIIYVNSKKRTQDLAKFLSDQDLPVLQIDTKVAHNDGSANYQDFKDNRKRILVTTSLFSRGMDINGVDIVINYDMPKDSDAYLHRATRSGRFGCKGLAISFLVDSEDEQILVDVQDRFDIEIDDLSGKKLSQLLEKVGL